MALNLKKNTSINITKSAKHLLTGLTFGLAWDGDDDLDASAVILKDGKLLTGTMDGSLVGFPMNVVDQAGNIVSKDWEVKGADYSGDARNGAADGFDEEISFQLNEIEGDEIVLFLTSYSEETPVSFGSAINPKATLCSTDGKELADVCLASDAAFGTAFKMVRIYLDDGEWKVENVSELLGDNANGLVDVLAYYGV